MNKDNRYFVYVKGFDDYEEMAVIEEEKKDVFVVTTMNGLKLSVAKDKVRVVMNQRLVMLELFDKLIKGYD